jgi:hypothetical protein
MKPNYNRAPVERDVRHCEEMLNIDINNPDSINVFTYQGPSAARLQYPFLAQQDQYQHLESFCNAGTGRIHQAIFVESFHELVSALRLRLIKVCRILGIFQNSFSSPRAGFMYNAKLTGRDTGKPNSKSVAKPRSD